MLPPEIGIIEARAQALVAAKAHAIALAHESAPVASDLAAVQERYSEARSSIEGATSVAAVDAAYQDWSAWSVQSPPPPPEWTP